MWVVAAGMLAGCNAPVDKRVQLRYMAWGNPEQLAIEDRLTEEFNKLNPDIHVQVFKVPQSAYRNKMILMFASRTAPDVVRVDHYDFPQLAVRDYFHDLDEFIAQDKEFNLKDYYPGAVEEGRVNGKIKGLNVLFGGGIMFYNQDILAQAGLEDPNALWKRGEWTYDKVREYAVACTKFDQNGKPVQFGVNVPAFPFYFAVVQAFGGKFLNDTLDKCLLDSPEAVEAMQYMADLRWKYRCAPSPAQGAASAFAFETGKLALEFNYIGNSARLRQMKVRFKWDVCPMPLGSRGDSFFVKGNQLTMYQETKHPQEAWRFMKFLTGPDAERILYIQERRQSPTRMDLAKSEAFLHPKEPPFNMEAVALTVARGKTLPIGPRWQETITTLTPELDNLFAGREKNAAIAMKRATADVNKNLAEEPGF